MTLAIHLTETEAFWFAMARKFTLADVEKARARKDGHIKGDYYLSPEAGAE